MKKFNIHVNKLCFFTMAGSKYRRGRNILNLVTFKKQYVKSVRPDHLILGALKHFLLHFVTHWTDPIGI